MRPLDFPTSRSKKRGFLSQLCSSVRAGRCHDRVERQSLEHGLTVLAVRENHHQVAGRVEEVERLEQPRPLFDGRRDRRALIGPCSLPDNCLIRV